MGDKIYAPFTDAQVEALNEWQDAGVVHPFTCVFAHSNGHVNLVATNEGWRCPDSTCPYIQDWAHEFMADEYLFNKMTGLLGKRVRPYNRL